MARSEKLDLKEHIASKEKKQRYVNRLFETIAPRYDSFTKFMSFGMDQGWKRKLVEMARLTADEVALDLACGTGDITFALASHLAGGRAVGLDITQGMLDIAETKRREARVENASFYRGDIMRLPYTGHSGCACGDNSCAQARRAVFIAGLRASGQHALSLALSELSCCSRLGCRAGDARRRGHISLHTRIIEALSGSTGRARNDGSRGICRNWLS